MFKITAVIQPHMLNPVKDALIEAGFTGITVEDVRGHGRQKGHTEIYRGREYKVDLLRKVLIELVVAGDRKDDAIAAISESARSGKIGDGKIFVEPVLEAIRIRNDDRGEMAL